MNFVCLLSKTVGEHLFIEIPKFCLEVCIPRNVLVKFGNILLCCKFVIKFFSIAFQARSQNYENRLLASLCLPLSVRRFARMEQLESH